MKLRLKLLDDDGRTIATATIPLHDDDRYTGLDTPEDCRQALVGLAQQARRELEGAAAPAETCQVPACQHPASVTTVVASRTYFGDGALITPGTTVRVCGQHALALLDPSMSA